MVLGQQGSYHLASRGELPWHVATSRSHPVLYTHATPLLPPQAKIPKDAKVLVGCQKGLRSLAACEQLSKAGYPTIAWVNGGFDSCKKGGLGAGEGGDGGWTVGYRGVWVRVGAGKGVVQSGWRGFVGRRQVQQRGGQAGRRQFNLVQHSWWPWVIALACSLLTAAGEVPTVGDVDIRYAGIGGLSELIGWTEVQQEQNKG